MRINHKKVQFFCIALMIDSAYKHSAGIDPHHLTRRKICYGDACFAYELFRLIVFMYAAEDNAPRTNFRSFLDFGTASHSRTFTALKSLLENVSKST